MVIRIQEYISRATFWHKRTRGTPTQCHLSGMLRASKTDSLFCYWFCDALRSGQNESWPAAVRDDDWTGLGGFLARPTS